MYDFLVAVTCKSPAADPGLWLNWSWRCSAGSLLWFCWGQRSRAWPSRDLRAAWRTPPAGCRTGFGAGPGGTEGSQRWSGTGFCRIQKRGQRSNHADKVLKWIKKVPAQEKILIKAMINIYVLLLSYNQVTSLCVSCTVCRNFSHCYILHTKHHWCYRQPYPIFL